MCRWLAYVINRLWSVRRLASLEYTHWSGFIITVAMLGHAHLCHELNSELCNLKCLQKSTE